MNHEVQIPEERGAQLRPVVRQLSQLAALLARIPAQAAEDVTP